MKTVLVVDDNSDVRSAYAAVLDHFSYEVFEAENGAEAVRLARTLWPHLILMDLRMPVMDGWSAATALRKDNATARIPILAITAEALSPADRERMEQIFDGYLNKPCTMFHLRAEVRRLLHSE